MAQRKAMRYNIQVENRPGQLTKLTGLLAEADIDISAIAVASIGDVASIEFWTRGADDLSERLRRSGLDARVES